MINELRDSAVAILLVFVITTIQLYSVLTARSYKLTEDAWATRLVAGLRAVGCLATNTANSEAGSGMP